MTVLADQVVLAAGGINATSGLVSLVLSIILAIVCSRIAGSKGRSPVLWGVLGFFFSLITLVVILVLPRKH